MFLLLFFQHFERFARGYRGSLYGQNRYDFLSERSKEQIQSMLISVEFSSIKGFLKNEMGRLKLIRFLGGITFEDFEEMKDGDKEFRLS